MTITKHEIRAGAYYDSIVLMQLQKGLADMSEVQDAGVVMATPANLELLTSSGFSLAGIDATPNDLLIVVQSENAAAADAALEGVDNLLQRQRTAVPGEDGQSTFRPRSLDAAASQLPHANWVLISVPGRYAADVARDALKLGKHIFLYSDNVPLEDEIQIKQEARSQGCWSWGRIVAQPSSMALALVLPTEYNRAISASSVHRAQGCRQSPATSTTWAGALPKPLALEAAI